MAWYVIHTLSGYEKRVKQSIERNRVIEGFQEQVREVLIPTEKVSDVREGKKTIRDRKIFPGYILVDMDVTNESWSFVANIRGVTGFAGGGGLSPVPLSTAEAEGLLAQIKGDKDKPKPKFQYAVGETVHITDGPFVGFTGHISETDPEKGRMRVTAMVFNRETPIDLEHTQVEPA
jgi:transcription termination/antitermination protein NusG